MRETDMITKKERSKYIDAFTDHYMEAARQYGFEQNISLTSGELFKVHTDLYITENDNVRLRKQCQDLNELVSKLRNELQELNERWCTE